MKNEVTKNNKHKENMRFSLYTLSTTCVLLAIFFAYFFLLEYDRPKGAEKNLNAEKKLLEQYEEKAALAHCDAHNKVRDSLNANSSYKLLMNKLAQAEETYNTKKYTKAKNEIEALESAIYTHILNNDPELNEANKKYSEQIKNINKIEKAKAKWDSIRQQPLKERMAKNWKQIRIDWHSWQKNKHIAKLKELQK